MIFAEGCETPELRDRSSHPEPKSGPAGIGHTGREDKWSHEWRKKLVKSLKVCVCGGQARAQGNESISHSDVGHF